MLNSCTAFIVFLLVINISACNAYAGTLKFNATRDVWISAYPGEEEFNMGAADRLKLKGIQEMALLDFDLTSLNGKKIEKARLYLCNTGKKNKLRKIGISTVAFPWVEGKSRGPFRDTIGKGATFLYSSYKSQRWADERSDLTDATMGMGYTWQHHTELRKEEGDWWSVDIAPELVNALIAGKSYGLLIMDESGQTFANNYVFSRESKHSPYIMITSTDIKKNKPLRPDAELVSSMEHAHIDYGAAVLKVHIREDIFAFDVFIDNQEVPLWRIPKPGRKGALQEIILDWLPPEQKVTIKISAVDELGQRSEPAVVNGYLSKSLQRITFQDRPSNGIIEKRNLNMSGDKEPAARHFKVWAVPDVAKIDPISGHIISEAAAEGFDKENSIWSEDGNVITLTGVRGEVVGFQLCIETENRDFEDIEVRLSSLDNRGGARISADSFNLYQVHYVKVKDKWYPELAVPMFDGKIDMKIFQKSIENRRNQLIYIDLDIPSEITPGLYSGKIIIMRKDKSERSLAINLDVKDIVMPQKLVFVPELNMYKGPGTAGTEKFFQAHRIAHEHRTVINRIPYSQDGRVHADMIPAITYSDGGEIKIDWADYDKRLGSLFDGTAFTKGGRKGIPVERFYLPFFENWPSELSSNYKYGITERRTQETISRHALDSPSLDEALTSEYKDRFVKIAREFKKHFEANGWSQTEFQFYLNNKWKWTDSSSWWNLDEPLSYDDWMALKFYGVLFQQAFGAKPSQFVFRSDISRQRWQHDWLNGILNRMYVQSEDFFRYPDRARKLKKDGQIKFSVYGSLNDIDLPNQQTVMWCMCAYIEGADGVLPWQSLGGTKAFAFPDKNALIVNAKEEAGVDWVVSLRVKALRRCQQNVELLAILERENGYNREQIRDLFYRYFDMRKSGYYIDNRVENIDTDKMEHFRKILINTILMYRTSRL